MHELIREVPTLVFAIEEDIEKHGAFVFTMYGSCESRTSRIDEKYKSAIKNWCKYLGYRFEDLHNYYHEFRITNIN